MRRAHLRLPGRGHVDEDRDEQQQRIAEQAEKAEAEGEGLADLGGDLGRQNPADPHGEQRVQNPPAVHRKRGDQIEDDEKNVGRGEPAHQRQMRIVDLGELARAHRAERQRQREADDQIDGGPGERDDQLLARVGRQALQAGDAADRQERHFGRLDAVAAGGEDVAELVQHHAEEEEDDEHSAVERGAPPAAAPGAGGDPDEEQEEGDMDLDRRAAEAADGEGPGHGAASRFDAPFYMRSGPDGTGPTRGRAEFPANREKCREIRPFRPIGAKTAPKRPTIQGGSGKIPYAAEQGINSGHQGIKVP